MILAKLLLLLAPWWQFVPTVPATPTSGAAPIAFVASASVDCSASATTCAIPYSPVAGHLVFLTAEASSSVTINSITDNATGGSCTYQQSFQTTNIATHYAFALFYCGVAKAGTTIIMANYSAAASGLLSLMEFSGGTGTQDAVGTLASGTGTAALSGSVMPTAAKNEVLIGSFLQNSSSSITFAAGAGYTGMVNKDEVTFGVTTGMEYQIVPSTSGSYTAGATCSATCNWWSNIVAIK